MEFDKYFIKIHFPCRKTYEELKSKLNDLQMQKNTIQEQVESGVVENKVLQSQLMVCKWNQAFKCYICAYEKCDIVFTCYILLSFYRTAKQMKKGIKWKLRDLKGRNNSFSKTKENSNLPVCFYICCLTWNFLHPRVQVDILSMKIAGQDEESKNAQEMLKESVRLWHLNSLVQLSWGAAHTVKRGYLTTNNLSLTGQKLKERTTDERQTNQSTGVKGNIIYYAFIYMLCDLNQTCFNIFSSFYLANKPKNKTWDQNKSLWGMP